MLKKKKRERNYINGVCGDIILSNNYQKVLLYMYLLEHFSATTAENILQP